MKRFMTVGIFLLVFVAIVLFYINPGNCKTIELKMSHFMPTKHTQHKVMATWANKIEKLTQGRIKITIFPGGALGKPPQQYDNATKGITDIAFGLQSYTPGRFPLTSCLRLPFMVSSAKQGSEVLWKVYEKYLQNEYKNVKVLWLFMHGPGQIFTTKKQIKTLEDLKGLKLRSPGPITSRVIRALGAVPVTMPITQVYTALERKTIDGLLGPWEIMPPFRFYEKCKYATIVNFYSLTFFVVMNKDKYNTLTPDIKKIFDENTGLKMSITAGAAYDHADKIGKAIFLKHGGKIYTLPPSKRARWVKASGSVKNYWLKEMQSKSLPGKEVLNYTLQLLGK